MSIKIEWNSTIFHKWRNYISLAETVSLSPRSILLQLTKDEVKEKRLVAIDGKNTDRFSPPFGKTRVVTTYTGRPRVEYADETRT